MQTLTYNFFCPVSIQVDDDVNAADVINNLHHYKQLLLKQLHDDFDVAKDEHTLNDMFALDRYSFKLEQCI